MVRGRSWPLAFLAARLSATSRRITVGGGEGVVGFGVFGFGVLGFGAFGGFGFWGSFTDFGNFLGFRV